MIKNGKSAMDTEIIVVYFKVLSDSWEQRKNHKNLHKHSQQMFHFSTKYPRNTKYCYPSGLSEWLWRQIKKKLYKKCKSSVTRIWHMFLNRSEATSGFVNVRFSTHVTETNVYFPWKAYTKFTCRSSVSRWLEVQKILSKIWTTFL